MWGNVYGSIKLNRVVGFIWPNIVFWFALRITPERGSSSLTDSDTWTDLAVHDRSAI